MVPEYQIVHYQTVPYCQVWLYYILVLNKKNVIFLAWIWDNGQTNQSGNSETGKSWAWKHTWTGTGGPCQ